VRLGPASCGLALVTHFAGPGACSLANPSSPANSSPCWPRLFPTASGSRLWDVQSADQFAGAEDAARSLGLSLRSVKLENPPYDFAAVFRALAQDDTQAALILSSPSFAMSNVQVAELAIKQRLPTMFTLRHYVEAGGLMSYGPDFNAMMRRAASYVAKILRGAQPSDLPVEQVGEFRVRTQSQDCEGNRHRTADIDPAALSPVSASPQAR
jgi:ABC transporter substrate binding protein